MSYKNYRCLEKAADFCSVVLFASFFYCFFFFYIETRSSFIPEIDILDIPDTSISDVPQPHISSIYRRKRKGRKGKGRKGKGRKGKGRKGKGRKGKGKGRGSTFKFGNSFGNVGQQGINTGHVALGHQFNSKRQMSFGATSGNVGQQGTNSGNVGVGNQVNGRK